MQLETELIGSVILWLTQRFSVTDSSNYNQIEVNPPNWIVF